MKKRKLWEDFNQLEDCEEEEKWKKLCILVRERVPFDVIIHEIFTFYVVNYRHMNADFEVISKNQLERRREEILRERARDLYGYFSDDGRRKIFFVFCNIEINKCLCKICNFKHGFNYMKINGSGSHKCGLQRPDTLKWCEDHTMNCKNIKRIELVETCVCRIESNDSLEELTLFKCRFISRITKLKSLKTLKAKECERLEFIDNLESVKKIEIINCNNFMDISDCVKLEYLYVTVNKLFSFDSVSNDVDLRKYFSNNNYSNKRCWSYETKTRMRFIVQSELDNWIVEEKETEDKEQIKLLRNIVFQPSVGIVNSPKILEIKGALVHKQIRFWGPCEIQIPVNWGFHIDCGDVIGKRIKSGKTKVINVKVT